MAGYQYFDLYRNLRTNASFRNNVSLWITRILKAEKDNDPDKLHECQLELLRVCHYNPGLLVPYFFPKYPEQDPMSLMNRPYTFSMIGFEPVKDNTICAGRQIGKCCVGSTKLSTRRKSGTKCVSKTLEEIFDEAS